MVSFFSLSQSLSLSITHSLFLTFYFHLFLSLFRSLPLSFSLSLSLSFSLSLFLPLSILLLHIFPIHIFTYRSWNFSFGRIIFIRYTNVFFYLTVFISTYVCIIVYLHMFLLSPFHRKIELTLIIEWEPHIMIRVSLTHCICS